VKESRLLRFRAKRCMVRVLTRDDVGRDNLADGLRTIFRLGGNEGDAPAGVHLEHVGKIQVPQTRRLGRPAEVLTNHCGRPDSGRTSRPCWPSSSCWQI